MENDGMDLDDLQHKLEQHKPVFLYTIPTFRIFFQIYFIFFFFYLFLVELLFKKNLGMQILHLIFFETIPQALLSLMLRDPN
jgi:hypothetical protein